VLENVNQMDESEILPFHTQQDPSPIERIALYLYGFGRMMHESNLKLPKNNLSRIIV
jgi:hypothetical protein